MTGQGFKPDPRNPAVRHYRGASRNVRQGETVNPPAIERAGTETPHLKWGALDFYPDQERTLSLTNLYTKRQRIAELARSKRGVALSTLYHGHRLGMDEGSLPANPQGRCPRHRWCNGGGVRAKPGGQSFRPPGARQVRPLSSANAITASSAYRTRVLLPSSRGF